MFDKHYEEQTPYITLDGKMPYANSLPIDLMFLGKKFKKKVKGQILSYMNVAYDRPQQFGTDLEWSLNGNSTEVLLIDETKLFVKGKHFWVYCVGIKDV